MVRNLRREESGVALVIAILTMMVLGSFSAAVVLAVTVNHRSAHRSSQAAQAFALAETGLAYAEGRLYSAATSGEAPLVPQTTFQQDEGTVTYSGTLSGNTWTLTGTGTVDGISRSVSAQATVPPPYTVADPTIWNYLYVDGTGSCTSISGSVEVNVPLYAHGGICLNGHASYTGSDLEVGGNLTLTGSARIGSSSEPISKLNVEGTCTPAPCDGAHGPIYVNSPGVGHTLTPTLTMPTIDLPGNYASTNPGPASGHSCPGGSGVPSAFFDGDTTLNNSVAAVNLFPAGQPYDCTVGSNEIKWDGLSHLTVNGTFYFDGSLSMAGNTKIVYSGRGTIYLTGAISMSGNSELCGIANCTSQWNPETNTLVLVAGCWANSTGSLLVASGCLNLTGTTKLQTGTYVTTDYTISGNAENMGPVLTNTASLTGNVTQMIPLHTLPPGAPSDTKTVQPPPLPTINWNG
jgi:hypothetical protein